MGDRANVYVREGASGVYLYAHEGATRLPAILQKALSKRKRWSHSSYLSRIIFDEMMTVYNAGDGETGYGIGAYPPDGRDKILVVDCEKQTIGRASAKYDVPLEIVVTQEWTFEEYLKVSPTKVWTPARK